MSPSEEENEKIVIKFLNALPNYDLETITTLIHNDYEIRLDQTPVSGIEIEDKLTSEFKSGKKGAIKRHRDVFTGFSNGKIVFKEIITKNDIVCVWFQQSGVHTGIYLGIPPTNKLIKFEFMNIYKIKDGQIISAGGVRKGSFLFQIGKTIIAENIDTSVQEYMDQLRQQGLIK